MSSGFNTGEGTYDKEVERKGEGLDVDEGPTGYHGLNTGAGDIDTERHGREGFSTDEGEADNPGSGFNAGQDGHRQEGGGVSLNAGGDDDNDPNAPKAYDVGDHLKSSIMNVKDKLSHKN